MDEGSEESSDEGAYAGGGTDNVAGSSGGNFASMTIMVMVEREWDNELRWGERNENQNDGLTIGWSG